ncbi:MAG: phosphopantothenoylcysteine decarboxylase/phosphopantothenate--cysteine ligase [Bacteroidia bacterium]|jgi:phosphopantothenoylcysteine decarboxylase/phosphopantothenate--cysteine ligase
MISEKNIVLGVCGGIAAYKVAVLTRDLVKAGANVHIVMTRAATAFIGPLTLSTLSKNKVETQLFDDESGEWTNHVELALWADLLVIAPATSNTIAKMANGICDNLLLATYLSAKSKVMLAPAMDLDMASHPSLLRNLNLLEKDGVQIIPSEEGELASGLSGKGRMAEPATIFNTIQFFFEPSLGFVKYKQLEGKRVLVNAGPTYEPIDPVRFIGNRSSGKMGIEIAKAFAQQGSKVILVHGPISVPIPNHPNIDVIAVQTAQEMFTVCTQNFTHANIAVLSAAVADYTPKNKSDEKIKKSSNTIEMTLVKTPDTLAALGKAKQKQQLLVGFALETQNELENAKTKLTEKNLDLIVLNSLRDEGAGFSGDTNKVSLIDKSGEICTFDLKSKTKVADDIIEKIAELIQL